MATLKELREKAKAYELKSYSKLNKAQLEELISKYDQAAQEATPEISTTDNSNPDDNPDPTPPSNGGNSPETSKTKPETTTQSITIIPEYATLHNGNIDITGMSLTPEELHSRMGFTASRFAANYRVIANSTKGTFSFTYEGNKHPLCAYDIRTDKFILLDDGDSRSKNNMTLVEKVFRQRITEFFSLPSQKAIQNSDKFSVGSGENKRTYHITTRRIKNSYLDRLFGILIDVCNSDNEVIASYAPLWHEDFVFNAKYPIHTSTKSAIEKAFMKKLPLFLKKSNLSNDNGRIISDGNEDLRNAVDKWCNTWGHNIGNFPIHEYDRKHQHESVQEVNAEPETPKVQPIPNRENLETMCWQVYDYTNTEDMHAILDILNTETLTAMCRIVNAPVKSSTSKSGCIDAFIAEATAHKAKQSASSAPATIPEITPDYDAAFDEPAYNPDVQNVSVIVDDIPADHEPNIAPVSEPQTPAKFVIGRHYQSIGSDISTVTFVGKCSHDYGYFVDSINCYHRVKIKTDSSGEYASISHKGGMYPPEDIKATVELPEHEIISVANGTCVLLNAETVIHSYQELEAMLAPKSVPVSKQPAPAPETKTPYHVKKIDDSGQFLICFDNAETPANIQPTKPKPHRRPRPRIKRDYTRQILIDFGEDIADGKTYHRQAA